MLRDSRISLWGILVNGIGANLMVSGFLNLEVSGYPLIYYSCRRNSWDLLPVYIPYFQEHTSVPIWHCLSKISECITLPLKSYLSFRNVNSPSLPCDPIMDSVLGVSLFRSVSANSCLSRNTVKNTLRFLSSSQPFYFQIFSNILGIHSKYMCRLL